MVGHLGAGCFVRTSTPNRGGGNPGGIDRCQFNKQKANWCAPVRSSRTYGLVGASLAMRVSNKPESRGGAGRVPVPVDPQRSQGLPSGMLAATPAHFRHMIRWQEHAERTGARWRQFISQLETPHSKGSGSTSLPPNTGLSPGEGPPAPAWGTGGRGGGATTPDAAPNDELLLDEAATSPPPEAAPAAAVAVGTSGGVAGFAATGAATGACEPLAARFA